MGVSGQKNTAKFQKKPDPRDPYALALAAQGFQGHQGTVHGRARYSAVTCLHTAVTDGLTDARQSFCEKARNINGLRNFVNFSGFLGLAPAGGVRTRLSSLEILLWFVQALSSQKLRQSLLDISLRHCLQVGVDVDVLRSIDRQASELIQFFDC